MEKIVYLLGAGFSAPLGLPLVNDFLIKAKDMHALHVEKYGHFAKVFQNISEMHVAKSYFHTDLFNIEEILSILEMREQIARSDTRLFITFLKDVIEFYTPDIPRLSIESANWWTSVFDGTSRWTPYFTFVANLLGLNIRVFERQDHGLTSYRFDARPITNPRARYNIISLNYDRVLEEMSNVIVELANGKKLTNGLCVKFPINSDNGAVVGLAKLHGSVDSGDIIAPTWNKGLTEQLVCVWDAALRMLSDANQIRIIGYSLPISDAYIKYLLKSAVINAPHLKRIDVLCLDGDGKVKSRYDEFIEFSYYRFMNSSTEEYLGSLQDMTNCSGNVSERKIAYSQLEHVHKNFFS